MATEFHKTVFTVTVLSARPVEAASISGLASVLRTRDDLVITVESDDGTPISPGHMAALCLEHNVSPSMYGLADDGTEEHPQR